MVSNENYDYFDEYDHYSVTFSRVQNCLAGNGCF